MVNDSFRSELEPMLGNYVDRVGTTMQGAMRDILTDLRHIADKEGIDFYTLLDGSYQVYLEELADKTVAD